MHRHPARVRLPSDPFQGIEAVGLTRQRQHARLQRAGMDGVAPAPHLHQQGIEARTVGPLDHCVHGRGTRQGEAHDPESAHLGEAAGRPRRPTRTRARPGRGLPCRRSRLERPVGKRRTGRTGARRCGRWDPGHAAATRH